MSKKTPTLYEEIRSKGYSRRDFLKFCGMMGAMMGLEYSGVTRIVQAMEMKSRLPVVWLHFQECTGCSESFIRSSHPIVADIILDKISLDYTETLMAAAGQQAEENLHQTMEKYYGEYLLMVEGSVPTKNNTYCCIGGKTAYEILQEAAEGAKAIIAWGSCSCYGNVQAAAPNPTGATPVKRLIKGKPVINVPGCPPVAEVMAGVVVHLLTFDRIPQLDGLGRPKVFYSCRVHDTCYRRTNFDDGLFVESFDDENAKRGYCFFEMGCRGPITYNSCGVIKWNEGTSFPIQSGHPCIGCSEAYFWDNGPFYEIFSSVPDLGTETTADGISLTVGMAAVTNMTTYTVNKHPEKNTDPGR